MHYYIDGYNLLFRLMHTGENLQSLRENVIQEINKKAALTHLNVSIVFDAPLKLGEGNRSHYDAIEILYTSEGETADEFLITCLKNSPQPHKETIVTSDKKLALRARHKSAHTVSVEEFIDLLNRRYKNKLSQLKRPQPAPRISSHQSLKQVPKAKQPEPVPKASAEECLDYYELTFQANYEKLLQEEKQQIAEKEEQKRKNKRRPKPPRQSPFPPEQKDA